MGRFAMSFISMGDVDLLHPPKELELRRHKLKRLGPSPNSFFMDVKCPGCFTINTVFSHASQVVLCGSCSTVLCQPSGARRASPRDVPSARRLIRQLATPLH